MNGIKNPKVSVVIAAYNLEHCIRDSICSLQDQTFQDFEILVCEDCSMDNTYAILTELEQEDRRIRVIKNDINSGQALGRNKCFENARGEYIAIQDGDDYSRSNRLERQVAFLDENPQYVFAASLVDTINDNKEIINRPYSFSGEVSKESFLWGQPFIHPTAMFRAAALREVGGYRVEKETRYRNEDYDMFMRMYFAGMKGFILPERLYIYFEGLSALRRRKYRYRLAEAKIRYRNFKSLGLMPKGILYAIKPLIVGLFPQNLLNKMRKHHYPKS
ncbi:MAG: glycosyltransferase family 2 protein [Christensenellales bacterium]